MNTTTLYPLTFKPQYKERVWGSESWLLSGLDQDASLVDNGFLAGNTINEILEIYLADLLGSEAYATSGDEFPLLVKKLQVNDFLSVQVHPDDKTAAEMHNAFGKSEMWYVMEAGPEAKIYLGFNRPMTPALFYEHCRKNTLPDVLNVITPKKGECYYIPAGLVHACGGGLTLAEVQQVSDITYRVYDWGREHDPLTARDMHIDLAIDCIDYSQHDPIPATTGILVQSPYFTVTLKELEAPLETDGSEQDRFILYMLLEGTLSVACNEKVYTPSESGCLLMPASLDYWQLRPEGKTIFLEIIR
ncbi:MAG: type I phosphomannose isomerase catalytic subunit [Bacteroidales bacterium]|jgi:mannose-6-phosphate isomerase